MRRKVSRLIVSLLLCVMLLFGLTGCLYPTEKSIMSIEKTSTDGLVDTYTIYYTDGTQSTFEITNGADGTDGIDGEDGRDITVRELYDFYVETYGEIEYEEFLSLYRSLETDNCAAINRCLQSAVKIYCEFTEPTETEGETVPKVYTGAGIVYRIDQEYTYLLTNYHVVYDEKAVDQKISEKIHTYLYGSESAPQKQTDAQDNVLSYEYGEYAVECEYVGGAATYDIAVLKAKTSDLTDVNPDVCEIALAEEYHVGETAITIGNPYGKGISVTQGIISVDNEYISLDIDGTTRSYRSIRIDTPLYPGNSGGGLFNKYGELIGISNAGNTTAQNINYAIPLQIVKAVTNNVLLHDTDGDPDTNGVYKPSIGFTTKTENSVYVYDPIKGYGTTTEDILVESVTQGSLAEQIGLQAGDKLTAIVIDGTSYTLNRYFEIGDRILYLTEGVSFAFTYQRGGETQNTQTYTIQKTDLASVS